MAIKQLKFVKSSGRSSVGIYNYICRTEEHAQKSDKCLAIGSANLPDFASGVGHEFWLSADENERANAKVCSHLILTLARELGPEERQEQMHEFIQEHFKGCPLSWAIHEGYEDHNPHAHIMFSERRIQDDKEQGFSAKRFFKRNGVKKDREIHHKSFCSTLYRSWAGLTNKHLERAGIAVENHLSVEPKKVSEEEPAVFQDMSLSQKIERSVENRLQAEEIRMLERDELGIEDLAGEIESIKEQERVEHGRRAIGKFGELAGVNKPENGRSRQEDRGTRPDDRQRGVRATEACGTIEQRALEVRRFREQRVITARAMRYCRELAKGFQGYGQTARGITAGIRKRAFKRRVDKFVGAVKGFFKAVGDKITGAVATGWVKVNTVPDTGKPWWEDASKIEHEEKFKDIQEKLKTWQGYDYTKEKGYGAENTLDNFNQHRDHITTQLDSLEREAKKWNKKDPLLVKIYEMKITVEDRSKEVVPELNKKIEEDRKAMERIERKIELAKAQQAHREVEEMVRKNQEERKKKISFRPTYTEKKDKGQDRGGGISM